MHLTTSRIQSIQHHLRNWSDLPLRGALATTFIAHGYERFFGGLGSFSKMLAGMGVPAPELMAWLVAIVELAGGVLIALGLFTRIAAIALAIEMGVAIMMIHRFQGLMMHVNPGQSMPEGFEWQLALFCIALSLAIRGAGPLSLDYLIWRAMFKSRREAEIIQEERQAAPAGRSTAPAAASTVVSQSPAASPAPPAAPKREEKREAL